VRFEKIDVIDEKSTRPTCPPISGTPLHPSNKHTAPRTLRSLPTSSISAYPAGSRPAPYSRRGLLYGIHRRAPVCVLCVCMWSVSCGQPVISLCKQGRGRAHTHSVIIIIIITSRACARHDLDLHELRRHSHQRRPKQQRGLGRGCWIDMRRRWSLIYRSNRIESNRTEPIQTAARSRPHAADVYIPASGGCCPPPLGYADLATAAAPS